MRKMSRRRLLLALVAGSALILTACGGGEDPALTPPAGTEGGSTSFNDADVDFLQAMIPHHDEATQMAEMVSERTEREELRAFAQKIIADQSTEIDEMRSMLEAAGAEEAPAHDMENMDGQMDASEMTALEQSGGQEFDLMFLDMMIRHHQGAVDMAEQVIDEGENAQVADLANRIIDAQQAEIQQMEVWREEWSA
ncbi:MAG TPA: DUF305 domain-containing protein [Egibacteraceae bacterium]|nr:DUF305 domain-containing protein [Egibacteraceae bacterium]